MTIMSSLLAIKARPLCLRMDQFLLQTCQKAFLPTLTSGKPQNSYRTAEERNLYPAGQQLITTQTILAPRRK